jgi:H+/Cl- antiporter ClcA
MDRLTYALIGAVFGAIIGAACWWLYGLAFSLRYDGPGIDPSIFHWAKLFAGLFAILGLLFKDRVGSVAGSAIAGILNFEAGRDPEVHLRWWQVLVVLVLILGVVWYMTR